MDYRLAKQLKETGFPQICQWALATMPWDRDAPPRLFLMSENDRSNSYVCLAAAGYEVVADPTVAELLDACGEVTLDGQLADWVARSSWVECCASTPEEAVARLWLALNGHN